MNADELVEEVARDMWWETHTMPWFAANDGDKQRMLRQARAAIAVVLEEAAKVCEARYMGDNNREDAEAKRCAAAIRAMKPED